MQILQWDTCTPTVSSVWEDMCQMWEDWSLQKGVQKQKGEHAVHEIDVKAVIESQDEQIEIVSIDSISLNRNQFGEVVSRQGVQADPQKVKALTEMPAPKNKKELQSFLGVINYLGKFSPGTAEVGNPLQNLTSSRMLWTWNASYQQLFNRAKSLIKVETCMKFYDDTKPLYLETDASDVGLGAVLPQLLDNTACQRDMVPDNASLRPISFASKSLTGSEWRYSNIKWEVLGILHRLEKFHHYCFGREVLVITDHKPLIAMFKKDVATLSQHIQCILLKAYQYRDQIIYKPGNDIFIADWLSRYNHIEGKDRPIKDTDVWVDAIQSATDILEYTSVAEIQQASTKDDHLQKLKILIIAGWPDTKDMLQMDLKDYWSYRDELAVIDGVILKVRCIIIPTNLRCQILEQLHTNHMGIANTKPFACESVYWPSINADIDNFIKNCPTCLHFQ